MKRRVAAKATKAVAGSTDRATSVAEEMCQAAGWALTAEAIGQTLRVTCSCHPADDAAVARAGRFIGHHRRLSEKYSRAARRPWLTVEPDPPEPA